MYTLVSRKFDLLFTLYTYVLANILGNGAKFRYGLKNYSKSWFKKLQEFEQLQTSSGKSKELKFDGLLSKKMHSFS